jgi:hypothetical protein
LSTNSNNSKCLDSPAAVNDIHNFEKQPTSSSAVASSASPTALSTNNNPSTVVDDIERVIANNYTEEEDSIRVFTRFQDRSIADLRALARELGIDLSDCIERQEIVDLLASVVSPPEQQQQHDDDVDFLSLQEWGVSEIRALAAVVNVDCHNMSREAMIVALYQAAAVRPYMGKFLKALEPLQARSRTMPQEESS